MSLSSHRVAALRVSLLVSLGIVPMACGGTSFQESDEGDAGSGGTTTSGGTTGKGGSTTKAGSAGKGGSSSTAGSAGTGASCTSPHTDPATGLVTCAEGFKHRPTSSACGAFPTDAPAQGGSSAGIAAPEPSLPRADRTVPCDEDPSVCNVFEYGYCDGPGEPFAPGSTCNSGCVVDQDCGVGAICICGDATSPTGGVCVPSECATDQSCAPGYLCASYGEICGAGGFACQKAADECASSADCDGGICSWSSNDGHRVCESAVCGRPFLVDAAARVAAVVPGGAWAAPGATPRVDHLTSSERAELAAHWTMLGQMEHASIAAFARFSLQLLSLGAPPQLVDACTRALADETAHTKLCFQLASAYAAKPLGPGPLDVSHSLEVSSIADIVDLVILEGCFGETNAALDALEASETASDPVIRRAYAQIAEDEQRHAELAFQFVRWALERSGQAVAERIAAAISSPPSSAAARVALPCLSALLHRARLATPATGDAVA